MSSFLRLFHALYEADVRYVVVGGIAVVLHGHVRATADVDLILDFDPAETARALRILTGLGYRPLLPVAAQDFANPALREAWIQDRNMLVFTLQHPDAAWPVVDLLVRHPLPFAELWNEARLVDAGNGVMVRVCSLPHLLAMKRAAGRTRDLADIEELESAATPAGNSA